LSTRGIDCMLSISTNKIIR